VPFQSSPSPSGTPIRATPGTTKQILRRSQRQRRPPERYEAHWAAIEEPKTYVEAVTGTDRLQWKRAIKEELLAHEENRTWTIVKDLGQKTITSK